MVLEEDELLVALVVEHLAAAPGQTIGSGVARDTTEGIYIGCFQNHQLNRMESLRLRSLPLQRVAFPAVALGHSTCQASFRYLNYVGS